MNKMTAEEYFEEWWTQKELPENGFNKTAMLDFAEMYHKQALPIHDVIGSFWSDDAITRLKAEYFEKGLKGK